MILGSLIEDQGGFISISYILKQTLAALCILSVFLSFQVHWNDNIDRQSSTTARKTVRKHCKEETRLCWHRAEWERKDKTLLERKRRKKRLINSL